MSMIISFFEVLTRRRRKTNLPNSLLTPQLLLLQLPLLVIIVFLCLFSRSLSPSFSPSSSCCSCSSSTSSSCFFAEAAAEPFTPSTEHQVDKGRSFTDYGWPHEDGKAKYAVCDGCTMKKLSIGTTSTKFDKNVDYLHDANLVVKNSLINAVSVKWNLKNVKVRIENCRIGLISVGRNRNLWFENTTFTFVGNTFADEFIDTSQATEAPKHCPGVYVRRGDSKYSNSFHRDFRLEILNNAFLHANAPDFKEKKCENQIHIYHVRIRDDVAGIVIRNNLFRTNISRDENFEVIYVNPDSDQTSKRYTALRLLDISENEIHMFEASNPTGNRWNSAVRFLVDRLANVDLISFYKNKIFYYRDHTLQSTEEKSAITFFSCKVDTSISNFFVNVSRFVVDSNEFSLLSLDPTKVATVPQITDGRTALAPSSAYPTIGFLKIIAWTSFRGNIRDVNYIGFTNNKVLTPIYAARIHGVLIDVKNDRNRDWNMVNVSFNKWTIGYTDNATSIKLEGDLCVWTANFVYSHNVFVVDDLLSSDARCVQFQQDGERYSCGPLGVPSIYGYVTNSSFLYSNNVCRLASAYKAFGIYHEDEDNRKEHANIRFVKFINNTISILHRYLIVDYLSVEVDADSLAGGSSSCSACVINGGLRNTSLILFANNNISIDAFTATQVTGVAMTAQRGFRAYGKMIVQNNWIRMKNVYGSQVTTLITAISRFANLPDRGPGPLLIVGNDIEVLPAERGCGPMLCGAMSMIFGEDSTDIAAIEIENNTLRVVQPKAFGLVGVSLVSFSSLGVEATPPLDIVKRIIPNQMLLPANSSVSNLPLVRLSGNSIFVSGKSQVSGFSLVCNGNWSSWDQSMDPVKGTKLILENNDISIHSVQSAVFNYALHIGGLFSGFKAEIEFLGDTPLIFRGLNAILFLHSITIRNSRFNLTGGVSSLLATTGFLIVAGDVIFDNVSLFQRVTATTSYATYYPAFPDYASGYSRGLIMIVPSYLTGFRQSCFFPRSNVRVTNSNIDIASRKEAYLFYWQHAGDVGVAKGLFIPNNNNNNNNNNGKPQQQRFILQNTSVLLHAFASFSSSSSSSSSSISRESPTNLASSANVLLSKNDATAAKVQQEENQEASSNQGSLDDKITGVSSSLLIFPQDELLFKSIDVSFCDVRFVSTSSSRRGVDILFSSHRPKLGTSLRILNSSFILFDQLSSSPSSSSSADENKIKSRPIFATLKTAVTVNFDYSQLHLDPNLVVDSSSSSLLLPLIQYLDQRSGDNIVTLNRSNFTIFASNSFLSSSLTSSATFRAFDPRQLDRLSMLAVAPAGAQNLLVISHCCNPVLSSSSSSSSSSSTPRSVLDDSDFAADCVEINARGLRSNSALYSSFFGASVYDVPQCLSSFSRSLSKSISELPQCSKYQLLPATTSSSSTSSSQAENDDGLTVIATAGKTIRIPIALVVGSELDPRVRYAPNPNRVIQPTAPPVGTQQRESFTVFRDNVRLSGDILSKAELEALEQAKKKLQQQQQLGMLTTTSSSSSSFASSPFYAGDSETVKKRKELEATFSFIDPAIWKKDSVHSLDLSVGTALSGQVTLASSGLVLEVRVANDLDQDKDHYLRIAVSPDALACLPSTDSPVDRFSKNSWPFVNIKISRRARSITSDSAENLNTAAYAAGFLAGAAGNSMMLSQMNRGQAIYSFLDCQFSDTGPIPPTQSPIPCGLGDAEKPGYFQRCAIIINLVIALIVATLLASVSTYQYRKAVGKFERRKKHWERDRDDIIKKHKQNLLLSAPARASSMKVINSAASFSFSSPAAPRSSSATAAASGSGSSLSRHLQHPLVVAKNRSSSFAGSSRNIFRKLGPCPQAPSFTQKIYSGFIPSHVQVPLIGFMQGTVSCAVALLRHRAGGFNDVLLSLFALCIIVAFGLWMYHVVFRQLPNHGHVGYENRKKAKGEDAEELLAVITKNSKRNQNQEIDVRQTMGAGRWFPKCEECASRFDSSSASASNSPKKKKQQEKGKNSGGGVENNNNNNNNGNGRSLDSNTNEQQHQEEEEEDVKRKQQEKEEKEEREKVLNNNNNNNNNNSSGGGVKRRGVVPRFRPNRFFFYRAARWFFTPMGDWVLYKKAVFPFLHGEEQANAKQDLARRKDEARKELHHQLLSTNRYYQLRQQLLRAASSKRNQNDNNNNNNNNNEGDERLLQRKLSKKDSTASTTRLTIDYSAEENTEGIDVEQIVEEQLQKALLRNPELQQEKHKLQVLDLQFCDGSAPGQQPKVHDRYFRERTDKVLDDYNYRGRHFGLIEYTTVFITALVTGSMPEGSAAYESCASWSSVIMIVNVLPFVYTLAVAPFRRKTLALFALITGAVLTAMSIIVGLSKLTSASALAFVINLVQIGLDAAVSIKLGVDVLEIFWVFEVETMLAPFYFFRHYLFHGENAIVKVVRNWFSLPASYYSSSSNSGKTTPSRLSSSNEDENSSRTNSERSAEFGEQEEEEMMLLQRQHEQRSSSISTNNNNNNSTDLKRMMRSRHASASTWDVSEEFGVAPRSSSTTAAASRSSSSTYVPPPPPPRPPVSVTTTTTPSRATPRTPTTTATRSSSNNNNVRRSNHVVHISSASNGGQRSSSSNRRR